jgi:hypothetical protein
MEYKEFEWSNHKWIARERWGSCHPIKPDWWYDPERVEIDDDGVLHLKTKWNPKSIWEQKEIILDLNLHLNGLLNIN